MSLESLQGVSALIPGIENVINVPFPMSRFNWGTMDHFGLNVVHEENGVADSCRCAHGRTTALNEELTIKLEVIEGQHKFHKPDKVHGRRILGRAFVKSYLTS